MLKKENIAEVEIKIELSESQYRHISPILLSNGFLFDSVEEQTDYYLVFEKADNGYNFKRLRLIEGTPNALLTEKSWIIADSEKIRIENESEILNNEAKLLISESQVEYIAKKMRFNYNGNYQGYNLNICEDILFLKNSKKHLLECEIITTVSDAKKAKDIIFSWFKDVLSIEDVVISPSILEMIIEDAHKG